jgi:hypothetical protein
MDEEDGGIRIEVDPPNGAAPADEQDWAFPQMHDMLEEARGALSALFNYHAAVRFYNDEHARIHEHMTYEQWAQMKMLFVRVDEVWNSQYMPKNELVSQRIEFYKRQAQQTVAQHRAALVEARMRKVRAEMVAAAEAAPSPGGRDAVLFAGAMPTDEAVESRRSFEESEVARICELEVRRFAGALQRHVETLRRESRTMRAEIKSKMQAALQMVMNARRMEFEARKRDENAELRNRKLRGASARLRGLSESTDNELARATASMAARTVDRLTDGAVYRNTVRALALLAAVLLAAGAFYVLWTNERAQAWFDPAEKGQMDSVRGALVRNLRSCPVRLVYGDHFRWMLSQEAPAPAFTDAEVARGFFHVAWRYGDGYNVTFDALEQWLARERGACVCAQHLGFDRFVAHARNTTMYDPRIVSRSVETVRMAAPDWLAEFCEREVSDVLVAPRMARVEYTDSAGRRMTARLEAGGAACVLRCGEWARVPPEPAEF